MANELPEQDIFDINIVDDSVKLINRLNKPITNNKKKNKKIYKLFEQVLSETQKVLLKYKSIDTKEEELEKYRIELGLKHQNVLTLFLENIKNININFDIKEVIKLFYYDEHDTIIDPSKSNDNFISKIKINIFIDTLYFKIDNDNNLDINKNIVTTIIYIIKSLILKYNDIIDSNYNYFTQIIFEQLQIQTLFGLLPNVIPKTLNNNEQSISFKIILDNIYKQEFAYREPLFVAEQFVKDQPRLNWPFRQINKNKVVREITYNNRPEILKDWDTTMADLNQIYTKIYEVFGLPEYDPNNDEIKKMYYMFTLLPTQTFEGNLSDIFSSVQQVYFILPDNFTISASQFYVYKNLIYDIEKKILILDGIMKCRLVSDPQSSDLFYNISAIQFKFKYIYDISKDKAILEFGFLLNDINNVQNAVEENDIIQIKLKLPQYIYSSVMFIDLKS